MTDTIASFLVFWDNRTVLVLCSLDDPASPSLLFTIVASSYLYHFKGLSSSLLTCALRSFTLLINCTGLPLRGLLSILYIYKESPCLLLSCFSFFSVPTENLFYSLFPLFQSRTSLCFRCSSHKLGSHCKDIYSMLLIYAMLLPPRLTNSTLQFAHTIFTPSSTTEKQS